MSTIDALCFRIYRSETRAEMVSDTVYFKHKYIIMPMGMKAHVVVQAAKEPKDGIMTYVPTTQQATTLSHSRNYERCGMR